MQLTKSMAIELSPFNIRVNAIAPGYFETGMTAPVKDLPCTKKSSPGLQPVVGSVLTNADAAIFAGVPSCRFCNRHDRRRGWRLRHPLKHAYFGNSWRSPKDSHYLRAIHGNDRYRR